VAASLAELIRDKESCPPGEDHGQDSKARLMVPMTLTQEDQGMEAAVRINLTS
jgi:hypothetical protein